MPTAVPLMSRKVDLEWVGDLVLREVHDPPKALPGATVRRVWSPDARLNIQDAKNSDKICYYEGIAVVQHRKSNEFYSVYRETIDALLAQQKDPEKYPKWLMEHPVKGTERRYFLARVVHAPKKLAATKGNDEMWWQEWLGPIEDERKMESLIYFLVQHNIGTNQGFARS